MNNNDILRRLRFALELEDARVIDMFARSGREITPDELAALLMKEGHVGFVPCETELLARFLDTLILDRRGPRTSAPAATGSAPTESASTESAPTDSAPAEAPPPPVLTYNEVLKKVRIALDLKEDDVVAAIERGDGKVTRPHLRGMFRSPGHKNYLACDEELLHAFLNGLTRKLRNKKD